MFIKIVNLYLYFSLFNIYYALCIYIYKAYTLIQYMVIINLIVYKSNIIL
jgi:hypothetical protein